MAASVFRVTAWKQPAFDVTGRIDGRSNLVAPVRTQTKFLVLLAVVLCVYLAGLISLHYSGERQARLLLEDKTKEKKELLKQMAVLIEDPVQTMANDYSLWSEMVSFVHTRDTAWARTNIYVGMSTYKADAAWVFRPDGCLIYDTAAPECLVLKANDSLIPTIQSAIANQPFNHFFAQTDIGFVEVRTAPIQPSEDEDRESAAQGYFCVAKTWDSEYVAVFERALQSKIVLTPFIDSARASALLGQVPSGSIRYLDSLPGPSGGPKALIVCTADYPMYTALVAAAHDQLVYISIFSLAMVLLLLISFRKWITRPLASIMHSLQFGQPVRPDQFQGAGIEFASIASLISNFFQQKEALVKEVTERKQIELDLRDRERLLRATLESTADGILVVDNETGKINWNTRFRELWRIPEAIANSGNDDDLIRFVLNQLCDPDAFVQRVKALYSSNDDSYDALEFLDGRTFERYSCPLKRGPEIIGRVWSFRDVTARISAETSKLQLQKQLEQAQRMESLGLLAGGVAHDLNNVLGPLVAYPEIIMEELPDDSPVRDDLVRMSKAAEHAASVIQDLLALARRGRYEMKALDLNEVVRAFVESIAHRDLAHKHPAVKLLLALADRPLYVCGSAPHLTKVIMNLVGNAYEATHPAGSVTIETSHCFIDRLLRQADGFEAGQYVVLRVRDTGPGIAPEDVAKIFEPYYSKKKMGRSGSGLGLAVVHGIVHDHEGFYDVDSNPGEGAEFILYFPISAPELLVESAVSGNIRGHERILVVDDDPEQRQMAVRLLSSLGYSSFAVSGAGEAMEFLQAQSADIVIMDMIMEPNPDGLDTYREILKIRPDQRAIIATGYCSTDRVTEMQRLGAGTCLAKPYTRDQIGLAIREELARERPVVQAEAGLVESVELTAID
jgi:signal transduction histidine kinase/ActR/RegA family two-component response regulator/sensor domain CHASE-containing protein